MANTTQGNPHVNEVRGKGGVQDVKNAVKNMGQDALDAASQKAKDLASQGSEMASQASEQAKQMLDRGSKMLSSAGEQAASSLGQGMRGVADQVRGFSPGVANTLTSAAQHLQEQGFGGLGGDLTNVIRRYPVQSVLAGIGIGFLLALATSSRRD